VNVARENGKIFVFVNENALVPALVQVSYAVVASIVITSIGYVELSHEFGKVGFGGFEKQMEMVGHENVTVKPDRVDIYRLNKYLEKPFSVFIILKNILTFISTASNMVHCIGVLYAEGACHDRSCRNRSCCQHERFDPNGIPMAS
jgi:hypothetical protein